jgi:acetyl-CoA acetyltransferase
VSSPHDAVVLSAALSPVRRRASKTVGQLAIDTVLQTLDLAELTAQNIDGLANFPSPSRPGSGALDGVDVVSPVYMSQALRLQNLVWHTSLTRGSFTGSIAEAKNAVEAGACKYALVWRAMHNPGGKYGRAQPGPAAGDDAFTSPYGFNNEVVKASMIYSSYMHKYGATREDMARFVVTNRAKAAANPNAVFYEQPISHEDYMGARMIAEPMSLLDCDMAVDGCAALIITRAENAGTRRLSPVRLRSGLNLGLPPSRRNFYTLEDFEQAARGLADLSTVDSGLRGTDFANLEFYDGFSYFPWLWMEAFGIANYGEARFQMDEAQSGTRGKRPLNVSGGSLGVGRVHGGAQVVEAIHQIQGLAGVRQIPAIGPVVVTSGSPLSGCGCLVFTPQE